MLEVSRHFTARDRAQGLPGFQVDAIADEVDRSVGQKHVDASRMAAASGGRGLLTRRSGTGQVEFRPVVAILAGMEQVGTRAVGSVLGVKLAAAWKINPRNASEIKRGFLLGKSAEVLGEDHRVACPIRNIADAGAVIEAKGGL